MLDRAEHREGTVSTWHMVPMIMVRGRRRSLVMGLGGDPCRLLL